MPDARHFLPLFKNKKRPVFPPIARSSVADRRSRKTKSHETVSALGYGDGQKFAIQMEYGVLQPITGSGARPVGRHPVTQAAFRRPSAAKLPVIPFRMY